LELKVTVHLPLTPTVTNIAQGMSADVSRQSVIYRSCTKTFIE